MLKNIPSVLSPDLLKTLAEMGHGDEIVLGDGNFPAEAFAENHCVRADGHGVPELLEAILQLIPLDTYVAQPAAIMQVVEGDPRPAIWDTYAEIVGRMDPEGFKNGFESVERFAFYERAKKAYAIVQTGEKAVYANIILKKGVVSL